MAKNLAKLVSLQTPKRRWAQFSLKSLLILTAAIGVGLGVLSYQHAAQQRDIRAIREAGADASVEARGPAWIRSLIGDKFFERVVSVELHGPKVTDETLKVLTRFATSSMPRAGTRFCPPSSRSDTESARTR